MTKIHSAIENESFYTEKDKFLKSYNNI